MIILSLCDYDRDVSFNKLVGELPPSVKLKRLSFLFLTGNLLSGNVPDSILKKGSNIDLSYNNFTWQGPEQPACQKDMNLNLNLFRSSLIEDDIRQVPHCSKNINCPRYSNCLHVNSGGMDVAIKENKTNVVYEGDAEVEGGTAEYFINSTSFWGFSSTGDFMDDYDAQNTRYTLSPSLSNISELYATARIAPISLTYFHYCLENGNYTVNLHFAEIQFTNDKTYNGLGKRVFNIYIQVISHKDENMHG
jgi:hypothetical protein